MYIKCMTKLLKHIKVIMALISLGMLKVCFEKLHFKQDLVIMAS